MAARPEDEKQAQLLYTSPELRQFIHPYTVSSKERAQESLAVHPAEGYGDYHQQFIKLASTGS